MGKEGWWNSLLVTLVSWWLCRVALTATIGVEPLDDDHDDHVNDHNDHDDDHIDEHANDDDDDCGVIMQEWPHAFGRTREEEE